MRSSRFRSRREPAAPDATEAKPHVLPVAGPYRRRYHTAPLDQNGRAFSDGRLEGVPILRFRLFGAFSIEDNGRQLRMRSRRARALIAYLIFAGSVGASRERLSGLLWSDRGDEQARASLRQCLLELRRELEEAGITALDVGREQ